jgi:hypothetical protein
VINHENSKNLCSQYLAIGETNRLFISIDG